MRISRLILTSALAVLCLEGQQVFWSMNKASVSLPTGAVARFKPSSLVGGVNLGDQIATWTDVTGNGWSATQVTSGNQATFVPAANTVAGKQPAIWFGGHTGVLNGTVDTWMTIPSGLSTNQNNLSILVFGEAGSINGPTNYIIAQLGQSGGSFTAFWPTPGLATYQDGFIAQVGGSTIDPHIPTQATGPFMYFLSSQGGANGITISDGVTTFQQTGPSSGALTGGALGSYSATGLSLPLVGSEQEIVIYQRPLTLTDLATAKKYATATYGTVFTQKRNQVIGTGDSITAGTGSSGGGSYIQKIQQSAGYYQNTDFTNIGVPGETMTTMASSSALETQLFSASYATHVDVLWGGTNDIAVSGSTAVATYASLTTKVAALQSAGHKVECVTMLPRGVGNQVQQQAYNTLILANTAGCDSIADPTTNPAFSGATINPADTVDGIHPNDAGYTILAPIIKAALVTLQ